MLKRMMSTLGVLALVTAGAAAQVPGPKPPQPKPAESAPAPRPEPAGPLVNVKLDLTITDQAGPGDASKKVVTMIVANGQNGSIRSRGFQPRPGNPPREVIINVDAQPTITRDGPVRVHLALEYSPMAPTETGDAATGPKPSDVGRSTLNERIVFMIPQGKPLVVSQAVDPLSDRRISVELTVTIMK